MKDYKVEYLIMIKHKGAFCDTSESFNKLLETNSSVSIKKDLLLYDKKEFKYEIFASDVKNKEQRYFKIKIIGENESTISSFIELLKIIREQIHRADGHVNILWDDISNYYSIKAYPKINKIENLLRKLITTFMLTNIGINWANETIPGEVKSTLKRKGKDESGNFLHETDFIQLADFLFKPYQTNEINNLFKQLKSCKDLSELNLDALKEYIPKSNWERYFKIYVACEDDYLNKKWNRLYELRCIIAHNNFLNKNDYNEINELVDELENKIQEAIDNIDKIIIPKEEQDLVAENAVAVTDERIKVFIDLWKEIENEVYGLYLKNHLGNSLQKYNFRSMVKKLIEKEILPQSFLDELDPIGEFRNKLIHFVDGNSSKEEIEKMIKSIDYFYHQKIFLETPFY